MAQYDGSIRINTLLNTGDFISSFRRFGNTLRGLISSLGFGLGIAGLVALGKQAVETASDIQEVQNVVDTAFGDMSYKMEQFADTAVTQFGISKLSAKEMGSTFMAMGASMVDSMEQASDMAIALTARSADMASFFNKSAKETATALKSIYTGETETLKAYGVVMTEVNLQEYAAKQGITKKISAMTQAEKVQLRYNYVMEQTALAAGDFAKTSDSWANQTRILSEQFKELLSVIGSGLITVLTPVVKFLNTILTQLIAIAKQIGAILSKLFGISLPTSDAAKFAADLTAAAGGADELTEGIEAAGKAAKGALAPFDDLQVLAKDTGGGAAAGGGAGGGFEIPELNMEDTGVEEVDAMSSAIDGLLERLKPLFDWFTKLKNLFVEGFFDGLGDSWGDQWKSIKDNISSIKNTILEIITNAEVLDAVGKAIESTVKMIGTVIGSFTSIILTIINAITGGIAKFLEENKEKIEEFIITISSIITEINELISKVAVAIAYVFEAFSSEQAQQLIADILGIIFAISGVVEFVFKLFRDLLNIVVLPFIENADKLKTALEGLISFLEKILSTIKQGLEETFNKLNEIYDEHFKPFFDSVATGLSELLGKFLDFWNGYMQPILDSWAEKFDVLWTEHIQPMIDNFLELVGLLVEALTMFWENTLQPLLSWIIDVLAPTLADFYDSIANKVFTVITFITDLINGIVEVVKGVINILIGIAKGDWQRVWDGFAGVIQGVADVIKGIINAIIGTIEGVANAVVAAVNTMIRAINSINFTVPDWIPGVGGKSVGFNLSEVPKVSIPRLANGAVLRGGNPFMAIVNDQPAGHTNIEAPLATIEQAVENVMNRRGGFAGGSIGNINADMILDGETVGRLVTPYVLNELGRLGYDVNILGVT